MNRDASERLKKIIIKDDSGIPDSVSEILKADLTKLFSEYFEPKSPVELFFSTESDGIKITAVIKAAGMKNVRILS